MKLRPPLHSADRKVSRFSGFTIVELLIVVVIIGILAAITIVAYNGIQKRAQAAAVSASLNQVSKKVQLYYVDNNTYPSTLAAAGVSDSSVTYQYTGASTSYCITGTQGSTSLYVSDTQSSPTTGGCPGHGQGGVGAVTNVATNPGAENSGGWYSNNGAVYPKTWDSTKARSGTHSVSSASLSSSMTLLSLYAVGTPDGTDLPVAGNTTYTIAIYFTADVAHSGQLAYNFRVGGSYVGGVYGAWTTGSVGSWTRATMTVTSPTGADMLGVGVSVNASVAQPAGTRAYVDDLTITTGGSVLNYADGNSPNWVWNGTPNASTSTGPPL
jgi:prepilin-type N-terminal cleavage/methylation domain-containing protein